MSVPESGISIYDKSDGDSHVDVAVVVLSCDRYADIWPIYFDLFFKYWPDCPYPVYLASNYLQFSHSRVITLPAQKNNDWSSCIAATIQKIPPHYQYLLFLMDDAFLNQPVSNSRILNLCVWARRHDVNMLKFNNSLDITDGDIVEMPRQHPYRATLMGSLWNRSAFMQTLRVGESAQQFELMGSQRIAHEPGFYTITQSTFSFIHGIKKGKWYPAAIKSLEKLGYRPDIHARPILPRFQTLYRYMNRMSRFLKRMYAQRTDRL